MMTPQHIANVLSDGLNIALVFLIAQEPLLLPASLPRGERFRRSAVLYARSALAVALPVVLAELGKQYEIWPGRPGFPSGHATFAASTAMVLVLHRGSAWLAIALPLTVIVGVSLVYAGWHSPVEVAGGFILGSALSLLVWRLTSRAGQPEKSTPYSDT